jgi:hypothetical protein
LFLVVGKNLVKNTLKKALQKDAAPFQCFDPSYPFVSEPESVQRLRNLIVQRKLFTDERYKDPAFKTVLHYFLRAKFVALGDDEFANRLFDMNYPEMTLAANMKKYIQSRIEREKLREQPRTFSEKQMTQLVKSTLSLNWVNTLAQPYHF